MNDRMAFVALYLALVGAGGFINGVELAWILAIVTAGLGAISEEVQEAAGIYTNRQYQLVNLALAIAFISWLTGIAAGVALLIG